jgi:hypothetical protein
VFQSRNEEEIDLTLEEYNALREDVLANGVVHDDTDDILSVDDTQKVNVVTARRISLGDAGITYTYTYAGTAENFRLVSSTETFYKGVEILTPPAAEEVQ